MKKYLIFSVFLSLFAITNANATTRCVTPNACYSPTTVSYPTTETTACYDAVPCDPCNYACDDNSGVYVNIIGGANWIHSHKAKENHFKFNTGYLVGGAVGYQFGNGFRLEGEISFRDNNVKHKMFDSIDLSDAKLHFKQRSLSYMANVYYDFDLDCDFVPYVGFGVGYSDQWVSASACHKKHCVDARETRDGFAWQAITGVAYKIDAKTSVGVEYRYLAGREHVHNHGANLVVRRMF